MAYYSVKNLPVNTRKSKRKVIYHKIKECTEGNNIEDYNFRMGLPPNARLCKRCVWLAKHKLGTVGYPDHLVKSHQVS
jgi:hypothetical protein